MKQKYRVVLFSLLILAAIDGYGQRWKLARYEADIYVSSVSFHGDIGLAHQPLKNNINGIRPSIGIRPSFKITQELSVALDLAYVMYGGKDIEGSSHGRVYSFNSQGFQHLARLEYYILGDSHSFISGAVYNRRGMINNYNKLYVYAFAGLGGVMSKSKVKDLLNGGEEPLENAGYDNTLKYAALFPVGVGGKWALDPRWSLGVEIGYNFTTSDHLDGYKSDFSKYRDSYYLTTVKLIMKIRNDRNGRPNFQKFYR